MRTIEIQEAIFTDATAITQGLGLVVAQVGAPENRTVDHRGNDFEIPEKFPDS